MGSHPHSPTRPTTPPTRMLRTCLAVILMLSVLSEARQLRRSQRSLKQANSHKCRDGSLRTCTCSDGTLADLTNKPCPEGSHPDVDNGCKCPIAMKRPQFLAEPMACTRCAPRRA